MLVLDLQASGLLGIPNSHLLDATVFACDRAPIRDVFVAGQQVIADGRHAHQDAIAERFVQALHGLRPD
jgi:formimidoylglutamate deiminase